MTDTPPEMMRRYRALLLARPPEQRLKMGCSMAATARALVRAAVLARDPHASRAAVRRALFTRFYGHEFEPAQRDRILAGLAPEPDATESALIARRWDAEYRAGRYTGEPPLAFVAEIVAALDAEPARRAGRGLYVGCGNGRNYLPLVDAGLRLCGLDLSLESLRQLAGRRPETPLPLVCSDFRAFGSARPFGYVVALQVFQHGTAADLQAYLDHAAALLEPGGLLFLRINSAATEIWHDHTILERGALGGLTVRYDAGPKTGMPVHFCSREELLALTRERFAPVGEPHQDVIAREAPKTGSWAQWEGIWRRRGTSRAL